ncbi:hypothetical protein JAAARDRAFT_49941 [Jaapia argillacea MUCL 33604]|uniref:Uncharacterized protein n=1 Tax=Jaapia argillacea MUCL 33604 TaxID=933084 RepID=A0A067PE82_9AGAM|nr:hypothetical protein JAAARDRAFT_49941 [Jaapia argillacea MUCL 33604]
MCEPYHGRKLIGWPALPGHLRSDNHTSSLCSSLRAQEEHTAELAREEQLRAEWSEAFLASWSALVNPPTSSQNDGYPHNLPSYHFDDDVLISLGDAPASSVAPVMADEYEQFQLGTAMRLAKSLGIGHTTLSALLEFGDEELVDSTMTNVMQDADLSDDPDGDEIHARHFGFQTSFPPSHSEEWFPYANKTLFLLDTLDNLPRLRILDTLMRMILWVLCEAGAKNDSSIKTIKFESVLGNIFYMNDITAIITKIWHGEKLCKEVPLHQLCPHYIDESGKAYFVDEFARLRNGQFIIPKRWRQRENDKYIADGFAVICISNESQAVYHVDHENELIFEAKDLAFNFLDLLEHSLLPCCDACSKDHLSKMPNPLRELAEGEPLYSSWISVWCDDMSANCSKSWNKHWNTYITHANLPRRFLQQEFHVHFASTSPSASIVEQFGALKKLIDFLSHRGTHKNPIRVPDPSTVDALADNPMQSEECGHIGGNGNCDCRKCSQGGSEAFKVSSDGYDSLFEAQNSCTADVTLNKVRCQVKLACSSIESAVKTRQTNTGVKDAYTQHWIDQLIPRACQLKVEKPQSTEEEITNELMTWVVENGCNIYNPFLQMEGIVKLQSSSIDGLTIPPIRSAYLHQYRNLLIGRQFKQILQTSVFHLHGKLDENHFLLWKAVGSLCALLWYLEIANLEEYLCDLKLAIDNVLNVFAVIDPTKIWKKIKLHLLVHIIEDVQRFGPIIGRSTEVFECFNAIFQFCAILSNRLAPSHDIAIQLADQESFKQRITGGMWKQPDDEWVRASPKICGFLEKHHILQNHLRWMVTKPVIPGAAILLPEKKRQELMWCNTAVSKAINPPTHNEGSSWLSCHKVTASTGDICKLSSWVFVCSPFDVNIKGSSILGQINEIIQAKDESTTYVTVNCFEIGSQRHQVYDMPVALLRQQEQSSLVVDLKCVPSGLRPRQQEREDSGQMEKFIEHKLIEHHILNMHALHNAHLLHSVLPRDLTIPQPYLGNQRETHDKLSSGLKVAYDIKQAKQKEAKEKKKQQKDLEKQQAKNKVQGDTLATDGDANGEVPRSLSAVAGEGQVSSRQGAKKRKQG